MDIRISVRLVIVVRTFHGDYGLFVEDILDTFTQLLSGWV